MKKLLLAIGTLSLLAVSCSKEKTTVIESGKDTLVVKHDTIAVKNDTVVVTGVENIITKNVGKYPEELKLFDDSVIGDRIKKLAGNQYDAFKKNFNVETPIAKEFSVYKFSGCKQHNCPAYQTTILYDAAGDNLNIIIDENGKSTVLKEKAEITYSDALKAK